MNKPHPKSRFEDQYKTIDDTEHYITRHAMKRSRTRKIPLHRIWDTCDSPDLFEPCAKNYNYTLTRFFENSDGTQDKLTIITEAHNSGLIHIHTVYYVLDYTEDKKKKRHAKTVKIQETKQQNYEELLDLKEKQKGRARGNKNSLVKMRNVPKSREPKVNIRNLEDY